MSIDEFGQFRRKSRKRRSTSRRSHRPTTVNNATVDSSLADSRQQEYFQDFQETINNHTDTDIEEIRTGNLPRFSLKRYFRISLILLTLLLIVMGIYYTTKEYNQKIKDFDSTTTLTEIPTKPMFFYSTGLTDIFFRDATGFKKQSTIKKGDSVEVIATLGDYYKIDVHEFISVASVIDPNPKELHIPERYVKKDQVVPATDSNRVFFKEYHEALAQFPELLTVMKYMKRPIEQVFASSENIYYGNVNSEMQRSGEGSYIWSKDGYYADSIYIGEWEDDVITGEGFMYYYKEKKQVRGIWKNNKLIEEYEPFSNNTLHRKLDSVMNINRMK